MKEQIFSLEDKYYLFTINAIMNAIEKERKNFAIVGGIAVQAYLIDIAKKEGLLLPRNYLRKTDDVDIVFSSLSSNETLTLLSKIDSYEEIINNVYCSLTICRIGEKRPIIKATILEMEENEQIKEITLYIKMNLTVNSENAYSIPSLYYKKQVEESVVIRFDEKTKLKVSPIYLVVASKLIKGREKDITDTKNIASILSLTKNAENYIDTKMLYKVILAAYEEGKCNEEAFERYENFVKSIKKPKNRDEKIKLMKNW